MAVLPKTSIGDLVINLYSLECPLSCKNFINLCKINYYDGCSFYDVQRNFLVQTGLRKHCNMGHTSIYGFLYGEQNRFFDDEIKTTITHIKKGTISMVPRTKNCNGSAFFISLTDLPAKTPNHRYTIFGEVSEGFDTLERINDSPINAKGQTLKNILIEKTLILNDPYPKLPGLGTFKRTIMTSLKSIILLSNFIEDYWKPLYIFYSFIENNNKIFDEESKSRAVLLEMIGDLPRAEIRLPKNILFICNLNSVTSKCDLELIFSKFGRILKCQIIRDWKNGVNLNYGFIEFDNVNVCNNAYCKMNNVIIDERRIKVDFSQSLAKMWKHLKKK